MDYTVRAHAGTGTLGTTWHATDLASEREVALRVVEVPARDAATILAACQRLQAAAVDADYPGIVAPLTVEPGNDGAVLVATPYLDGGSLADVPAADEPLPVDAVLSLLRDAAAALARAHARGLVHGGVSPTNIFADADGRARLTDFGMADVARLLPAASDRASLSAYVAPEQWRGQPADARTDQYALAVVAYELLRGERHRAPSVEGIATVAPIEIPAFTPLRPDLDLHVNEALRTALAASPINRFPTVAEFADTLDGAARRRTRGRARPFIATRYLVAAVAVALLAGAAAVSRLTRRAAVWPRAAQPAAAPMPAGAVPPVASRATGNARARPPIVAHRRAAPALREPPGRGYLSVSASAGAPLVVVDGRSWGAAPTVVATAPGAHQVEVRGPGMHYRPARITVGLRAGDTTAVAFWREP